MTKIFENFRDDFSMNFREIKCMSIYYWYRICNIETNFKHCVHEKIYNELITKLVENKTNIIKINKLKFDVDVHECDFIVEISHFMIFENFFQIDFLIETKNALLFVSCYIHIQIIDERIHIRHLKALIKSLLDLLNELLVEFDDKKIVHVNNDDNLVVEKNVLIDIQKKIMLFEKIDQRVESNSKRLLELIKNFAKTTIHFSLEVDIFMRNFHVNFFINVLIQKNDFDIHLLYISIICNDNDENDFVTHKLNHDRKNFVIVKIFSLFEISNTSTRFVFDHFFIDFFLTL